MHMSRERYVSKWVRRVVLVWSYLCMPLALGWTALYARERALALIVAWGVFGIIIDPLLYHMAKHPERRERVGNWMGSGIVALILFGRDRR